MRNISRLIESQRRLESHKAKVMQREPEPSMDPELPPSWLTRKYIRWSIKLKAIIEIIKER